MMKCYHCNKYIPDVSITCPYCGEKIDPNYKPESTIDFGDVSKTDYDDVNNLKTYFKEPKNKKVIMIGIGVMLIVILVFVLLIISMFLGGKKTTASYKVFTNVTEEFIDYFVDNYTGSNALHSGTFSLDMQINKNENEFNGNYAFDVKNKLAMLDGTMKDPKESTGGVILDSKEFSFKSFLDGKSVYFQSNEVFNDINILFPLEDAYGLLGTKNYDIVNIISGLEDAISESLIEMDYYSEKVTINYLGEEQKVTEDYFKLDNKGKRTLLMTFYQSLIDNSNFINEVSRVTGKTAESITTTLNNYLKTADYAYSGESDKYTKISIYRSGTKIYRIEVLADELNKTFRLDIGETKYYFSYFVGDKDVFDITAVVTIKENDNLYKKTYEVTYDDDDYNMDFTLYLESNKKSTAIKNTIENIKNIRDFTVEDYTAVKDNLSLLIDDVSWVESFGQKFRDKCLDVTDCKCEDSENVCTCIYAVNGNNSFIECPYDVNKDIITE